jgi:ankyrin repeat protein
MKYIKLFEEHNYSIYELITMSPYQAHDLLMNEILKGNPDLELIKDILEYSVIDINSQDSKGWTALIYAADMGNEKCVELLLNHPGIDVNVQNKGGWTALVHAAYMGREKCVELLLKHPTINVKLKNEFGHTAWSVTSSSIREKFPQLNPNFQ